MPILVCDLFLMMTYKKYKKTINKRILSSIETLRSYNVNPRTIADNKNGNSCIIGVSLGLKDIPIHETPKIRAIFDMFEPTTAPIAIFSLLFSTEEIPTKISGAEVPNATTVKPIVSSLIPSFFANIDELSTNLSAPQIKTAKEAIKPRKFIRKSISNFTLDIKQIDYVSIIKNTI